jgi:hypothetical protein
MRRPATAMSTATTIIRKRRPLKRRSGRSTNSHANAIQIPAIKKSRKATSATVTLVSCEKASRGLTQVTLYPATMDVTDLDDASPSLHDIRLFKWAGIVVRPAARRSGRAAQSAIGYYP